MRLLFWLLVCPIFAWAGDLDRNWRTISSTHFAVHFDISHHRTAEKVVTHAEDAYSIFRKKYGFVASEKTHIVLRDESDASNGFASAIPRNAITLWLSAPRPQSTLGDYDDWLRALVIHEYLHIVQLDTIDGVALIYNKIFGKTWSPNQAQSNWLLEGLATYEESKQTTGGRAKGALFDAYLRTQIQDGSEHSVDRVSNSPIAWPGGNASYLYGSKLLDYWLNKRGKAAAKKLIKLYGGKMIPYGINAVAIKSFGRALPEMHREWIDYEKSRYSLAAGRVARDGKRAELQLTFGGFGASDPRYRKDGTLYWINKTRRSKRHWAIRKHPMTTVHQEGPSARRVGAFDIFRDGTILAEQTHFTRPIYNFQELVVFKAGSSNGKRLTFGERALDPVISPDEQFVAYVRNLGPSNELVVMHLPSKKKNVLWKGKLGDNAFHPSWSFDGSTVVFSGMVGGQRDIFAVKVRSGHVERLSEDRAHDWNPRYSPDGKTLYFISDRSGIANVYALSLTSRILHQVTNVMGHVIKMDVSPSGKHLVYAGVVADGSDIFELPLDSERFTIAAPYVDDKPLAKRVTLIERRESEKYRPIKTLAPQNYQLQGGVGASPWIEIVTSASDVIGRHQLTLGGSYYFDTEILNLVGSYSYNRLSFPLRLSGFRRESERGGFRVGDDFLSIPETHFGADFSSTFRLYVSPWHNLNISASLGADRIQLQSGLPQPGDPTKPSPRYPDTNYGRLRSGVTLNYSQSEGAPDIIGRLNQTTASLGFTVSKSGARARDIDATVSYQLTQSFHGKNWGRSTLYVRARGGRHFSNLGSPRESVFGGVPQQDLVTALTDSLLVSTTGYLRGYARGAVRGDLFQLINGEFRFSLFDVERGLSTTPAYLRRVHAALLIDSAMASSERTKAFGVSLGASLRMDYQLGYFRQGTIDVGYSRGLQGVDAQHEWWLLITSGI